MFHQGDPGDEGEIGEPGPSGPFVSRWDNTFSPDFCDEFLLIEH